MPDPRPKWPDWRCVYAAGNGLGWCNEPATHRAHAVAGSSAWWHYCEGHAPAGAERIPADELYYSVRVIGVLELAGLPGDPGESVEQLLAQLRWAVESRGGRLTVCATRVQVTAPAAASAPPLRLVGREGDEAQPAKRGPVRQPGRPEWVSQPRSRRRA